MGLLANSTKGLGHENVNGLNLVPYPPTKINAFILLFNNYSVYINFYINIVFYFMKVTFLIVLLLPLILTIAMYIMSI